MTIVLCSRGYPGKYNKNENLNKVNQLKIKKNIFIFHAGTKIINQNILAVGGRVLNFTSIGKSFYHVRKKLIKMIKKLNWNKGFYRKDIGWRVIDKT